MPTASTPVFEILRESYALANEMGLPSIESPYWRELLAHGRQGYGGKGDFLARQDLWHDFRRNVITKGLDNANVPEEALPRLREKCRAIHDAVKESIPARFRPFLEESPIGNPARVEVAGFLMSQSSLEYTLMLTHLEPYVTDRMLVVEIGGGYGGLARLLKIAFPSLRIVLLDLPEVNAIQTYFLATAFPERKLLSLRDVRPGEAIDPTALDFDFLVLPGQLLDSLPDRSAGLFINTRSMMEMDLKTVELYIRGIERKIRTDGFFYCLNRYEKKTRLKEYPFDDRWYVSYSAPWPRVIDPNPHHELVAGRAAGRVLSGLRDHVALLPPREGRLGRVWRALTSPD
jgi:putative sugar O-methyltransferase